MGFLWHSEVGCIIGIEITEKETFSVCLKKTCLILRQTVLFLLLSGINRVWPH